MVEACFQTVLSYFEGQGRGRGGGGWRDGGQRGLGVEDKEGLTGAFLESRFGGSSDGFRSEGLKALRSLGYFLGVNSRFWNHVSRN